MFRSALSLAASSPRSTSSSSSSPPTSRLALAWLSRLRWHAAFGQAALVVVATLGFGIRLPLAPLVTLVGAFVLSNVLLALALRRGVPLGANLLGGVLVFDALELTIALGLTGGGQNPFAVLYLVEISIAVVALGRAWIAAVALTSLAGLSAITLFASPLDGVSPRAESLGRWLALALAIGLASVLGRRVATTLRAQASVLAKNERLAHRAEKLASLSSLAAGAAHELATPLGTIAIASGELEELIARSDSPFPPEEALEEARVIRDEVERCRVILDRMSGRAGSAGAAPEEINAAALLALVRYELASEQRERLAIDGDLDTLLRCAIPSMVQVLSGLVANGFQASAPGERVSVLVSAGAKEVRFTVRDRGVGIPAAHLARVGEPFFTTKPPGKGMGLGLFLAQSFAELSSGSLRIASVENEGTEVCLTLPRDSREAPDARVAEAA